MSFSRFQLLLCVGLSCAFLSGAFLLFRPPPAVSGRSFQSHAPATKAGGLTVEVARAPVAAVLPGDAARSALAEPAEWRRLLAAPLSRERDDRLCRLLEELAAHDPQEAIAFALAIGDEPLRRELLKATLRGWASADLEAAGAWAFSQPYLDPGQAFSSLFNGANHDPQNLLRYVQEASLREPQLARDFGSYLIFALSQAGEHELAAAFAAGGGADARGEWLMSAYGKWGAGDPEEAVLATAALPDPAMQQRALDAAISGWAQTDPPSLAEIALALPPGRERSVALTLALHVWLENDVMAAADWIERHGAQAGLSAHQWERILEN